MLRVWENNQNNNEKGVEFEFLSNIRYDDALLDC